MIGYLLLNMNSNHAQLESLEFVYKLFIVYLFIFSGYNGNERAENSSPNNSHSIISQISNLPPSLIPNTPPVLPNCNDTCSPGSISSSTRGHDVASNMNYVQMAMKNPPYIFKEEPGTSVPSGAHSYSNLSGSNAQSSEDLSVSNILQHLYFELIMDVKYMYI